MVAVSIVVEAYASCPPCEIRRYVSDDMTKGSNGVVAQYSAPTREWYGALSFSSPLIQHETPRRTQRCTASSVSANWRRVLRSMMYHPLIDKLSTNQVSRMSVDVFEKANTIFVKDADTL